MLNYSYTAPAENSYYEWCVEVPNEALRTYPSTVTWVPQREYSSGDRIKGFRKRLEAGELVPFTAYQRFSWNMIPGSQSYSCTRKDGVRFYDRGDLRANVAAVLLGFGPEFYRNEASARSKINTNYLLQAAAANCYSQGYDLLTALIELPETISMFRGFGQRLANALNADQLKADQLRREQAERSEHFRMLHAKNSKWRDSSRLREEARFARISDPKKAKAARRQLKAALRAIDINYRSKRTSLLKSERSAYKAFIKMLESVTSDYLAVRYGLRPLIGDIQNLNSTIENWNKSNGKISFGSSSTSETIEWESTDNTSGLGGVLPKTFKHSIQLSVKASVAAEFTASKLQINPFVTAWEATRLSFVLDWFVNVGNAIESASLQVMARSVTACVGTKITASTQYSSQSGAKAWDMSSFNSFGSGKVAYEELSRSPSAVPYSPQVKTRLDAFKVTDIVALVLQAISKKKK